MTGQRQSSGGGSTKLKSSVEAAELGDKYKGKQFVDMTFQRITIIIIRSL